MPNSRPTPKERAEWRQEEERRACYPDPMDSFQAHRILTLLDALEEAEKEIQEWKARVQRLAAAIRARDEARAACAAKDEALSLIKYHAIRHSEDDPLTDTACMIREHWRCAECGKPLDSHRPDCLTGIALAASTREPR